MNRTAGRRPVRCLAVVTGMMLATAPSTQAHRLDEYLQATRIALSLDGVTLEIDLTPGTAVASRVLALVDANKDDRISPAEAEAYAHRALEDVALELDGRPQHLALVKSEFPARPDINAGTGTIHLEARGAVPAGKPGRHWLRYQNNHQADMGVYLVNALVPATSRIAIAGQRRDAAQHSLRLEYDVASVAVERTTLLVLVVSLCGLLAYRSSRDRRCRAGL